LRLKIIVLKKIISFFLKNVPRKYLQLFSHIVLKAASIFYYGNKVTCPVCEHNFRKFMPYGRIARENALCPNCLALERHRLMWLFLKEKTDFFKKEKKVLHIAPELCFIDRFEKLHGENYITADIESPLAKVKLDVHKMPFEDNTYEVVFCNHVMEHVEDDQKAMSEIYRVMKPEGYAILQIPLFHPLPEVTFEDKSIVDPKAREEAFGQDDHVRLYGKDYAEKIRNVGFEVVEDDFGNRLTENQKSKYALPKKEPIFFCKKV
jgi:SAM-dependent methyltransferase